MFRKAGPAVILLFFTVIVFWQVAFMNGILRWDAIHCFLAWRHNVAESISSGSLPLWSSFQHLGFPLHADPETGAWYPVVWLIALVHGYDFYAIQFEWCLHIFIAGCGMWRLCKSLGHSQNTSLMAAMSFMACGVFVSNAQNFIYLIGLAWSPWVFMYLRLALVSMSLYYAVCFSFCVFLLVTGSYPGITMILFYSLGAYFLYFIYTRRPLLAERRYVVRLMLLVGKMTLFTAGLCAVSLVSVSEFIPFLTRSSGLGAGRILENPFSPQAYISFITPYATGSRDFDWQSDFSMINAYCGLLTLGLILSWLVTKGKTVREWGLFSGFILLMLIALGDELPLRMWISHLPGLDLFRHPAIFRFPALMALVLLAYNFLHRINDGRAKRVLLASVGVIALVLICLLAMNIPGRPALLLRDSFLEWRDKTQPTLLTVSNRIFVQCCFQLLICAAMWILIRRNGYRFLAMVVCLDMLVATQLNVPATVVYGLPFSPSEQRLEQVSTNRKPYDGRNISGISSETDTLGIEVISENENVFLRQPAWDGYNSFILAGYDSLEHSPDFTALIDHPLVYSTENGAVYDIKISPNRVIATTECDHMHHLVLLQNFHSNWYCRVDDVPVAIRKMNFTLMGIEVMPGQHQISFHYDSGKTKVALTVTCYFLLLGIVLLVKLRLNLDHVQE